MSEKLRQTIKLSIVFFFILAGFFLACIFLLSLAHRTQAKNKIAANTQIQQQEISTWGKIPGELGYSWNRTYTPYQFSQNPTTADSSIKLKSTTPQQFSVKRDFEGADWYPQKSVVSYNSAITLTAENSANDDETYNMINLGAYDVWYQMVNKPKFFKSWQAITQAYALMLNSDYINQLFGYNVLNFYFKDEDDVNKYVLQTLSAEDAKKVYQDPDYGVGNVKGLAVWCTAATEIRNPESSAPAIALKTYWATQGVTLSDTQMMLLVGNGSQLRSIVLQMQSQIINNKDLHLNANSDLFIDTIPSQWGFAGVTQGKDIYMDGVTPVFSIKELNDQLPGAPEFGAFVLDPKKGNSNIDNTLPQYNAGLDFNTNVLNYKTFLNLETMQTFYTAWETKDQDLMTIRFGLNNWEMATLFHDYLDDMVATFLQQDGPYETIPLSHTMNKHINETLSYLNETLPLDLATRVMASKIKASGNDCAFYFVQAQVDPKDAVTICDGVDFTDPNTLKYYMNATWYGSYDCPQAVAMIAKTGITQVQYYYFYFPAAAPLGFGAVLSDTLNDIADHYNCARDATCGKSSTDTTVACNCTAEAISSLQWGSLGITQNPKEEWKPYTPVADSVADWGKANTWEPYNLVPEYIEYPQVTAPDKENWETLDWKVAQSMMTTNPATGSLISNFAWQSLLIPYYKEDETKLAPYLSIYGFNSQELDNFVYNMRVYIQDRIFGSAFASYTMTELLMGFENTVADKVNGGDYLLGDDFGLSKETTPIINDQLGVGKDINFGLYTGANGDDEIGLLRIINDQAYANKMTTIYNGIEYLNVAQRDPMAELAMQELSNVGYGMQFPPEIETDDQLKAYDQRNIKIVSYTHDSSTTLGNLDLKLEKFTSSNFGGDVGFAYNLPVFEQPTGCYECYVNATTFLDVQVDEKQYTESTTPSDNYLIVQPDSGYTYQTKKESTMYMIVGGNQTATGDFNKCTPLPDLDVLYGHAFPFYEYSETMSANEKAFKQKFAYIAVIGMQTKHIVIAFSILSSVSLILGIVAIVLYKCMDPKRKADHGEETLGQSPTGDTDEQ